MDERRFESRFLCSDLIQVEWTCPPDSNGGRKVGSLAVEAVLEDISPLGACVQVDEPIPPGAAISIVVKHGDTPRFSGHVSYCIYRELGYFVGIRFANETRWSSRSFEPLHLTNPQALGKTRAN
jgi:hypothetical protein